LTSAGPFDPPQEIMAMHEERPIVRLRFSNGDLGWITSRRATCRVMLADPRFSARQELRSTFAGPARTPPARPGLFIGMDKPDHTRYRRLLTSQFTMRRMRQLTEHIEQITEERLDMMAAAGPPTDVMRAFAMAIPAQVICEILGAPLDYRERFEDEAAAISRMGATSDEKVQAVTSVMTFLRKLVVGKRAKPGADLLSGLIAGSDLTDEEVTNMAFLLMGAGLDTTTHVLGLGIFALLSNPEQIPVILDPRTREDAVEELLRYLPISPGTARVALEDVELDGVLVKAGETVVASLPGANRDPEQFEDPNRMDLTKPPKGHIAFGYGPHQCLGQQLARTELQVAFPALFKRFPDLRLAVAADEVPLRSDMVIYGVHELQVTWGS
jgi:cytochrome P450